ncbi:MAG: hypothetical protein ACK5PB_20205 [Pirellula sp.]|jgi:hypothetical protein
MSIANVVLQIEKLLADEPADRILLVAKVLCSGNADVAAISVSHQQVRNALSRIQSLDEQLVAAARDLDNLACETPLEFEPAQVWTLIRTIKVQSQMLGLVYYPTTDQTSCSGSVASPN